MARSKASMLEEMASLSDQIVVLLQLENVVIRKDHLTIPNDAYQYRADFIRPAYVWLCARYDVEYSDVQRIKKMQPAAIWERYKKWGGFEEHREVLLLNDALILLRSSLVSRTRPDFFKKSKRNAKHKIKAATTVETEATENTV